MIPIGRRGYQLYFVEEEELMPHFLILGGTGTGKSCLAAKILQGIKGRKIVIDPHGDLCWRLKIPEKFPGEIYINPLEGDLEVVLPSLIYSLKNSFGKEFWGPRSEHLLSALLTALQGLKANLSDLYFLLSNRWIFEEFCAKNRGLSDLIYLKEDSVLSLLNKISPFLLRAPLREFFCRRKTKIPQGSFCLNSDISLYGRENARIICSTFFSYLFQRLIGNGERCWIACDEFQLVKSPSFFDALREGRKYGISLLLISVQISNEEDILENCSGIALFRCERGIVRRISRYYEVSEKEVAELRPREFFLLIDGEKIKLKTLYVEKKCTRLPSPEKMKPEDVIPLAILKALGRDPESKRVILRRLGLIGPKGEYSKRTLNLLSTFP